MAGKAKDSTTIEVLKITTSELTFCVVGTSPFICNAMSAKVRQDLLLPPVKVTATAKKSRPKHDPLEEYRRSAYKSREDSSPTRIEFPGAGFKGAICRAALDADGASKAEIGRLSYVPQLRVSLYGIQQMFMAVVRSADMNRTPDVRTRAIIPEWAATFSLVFVTPKLNAQSVTNLLAAAGITIGVGDFRSEKGKGNFGQFRISGPSDPEYQRIVATGGTAAQDEAFASPTYYDSETEELMEWYGPEVARRGFKVAS